MKIYVGTIKIIIIFLIIICLYFKLIEAKHCFIPKISEIIGFLKIWEKNSEFLVTLLLSYFGF